MDYTEGEKKMRKIVWTLIIGGLLGLTGIVLGQEQSFRGTALTIYNQNFALVRDARDVTMVKGENTINIPDIPTLIEPETVYFKSLTNPQGCFVLTQNFESNLVNPESLLEKYIGRKISVITKNNIYQGELLSSQPGEIILAKNPEKGPVFMINRNNIKNIKFSQLPQGLLLKPALVLHVENNDPGMQNIEIDYLTAGINWNSNYVAIMAKDKKHVSLQGWATIDNKSGTSYKNAELKLVAGQVHMIQQQSLRPLVFAQADEAKRFGAAVPQFTQKPSFEYYLYTLNRKTTIKNNQIKQISLLKALNIPVKKIYTYNGAENNWYYYNNWKNQPSHKNVSVTIKFRNSKKNNLGMPLPSGTVRVYREDTDGSLQLIGEDYINDTPKNEKVSLELGNAFDITGKREITEHKIIAQNIYMDSYRITLKNHKKQPVTVNVIENQFGQWNVIKSSMPYEKVNATTIKFKITIKPGKSSTITYTSEYKFL